MKTAAEHLERLRGLEGHLRDRLRGQDHVVARAAALFRRGELGLVRPDRPRGVFLAIGPTGTGKTELVLLCARYLFGEAAIVRIDLSEYQRADAVERLLGADGSDPGVLGHLLAGSAPCVLLFDELEKAHAKVFDLFIQMLDPGHVTVATGRRIQLQDCYIAFTSNLGAGEAARMTRSSLASVEAAVLRRLGETLRPEFLARIPDKYVFAALTPDVQREIGELHLQAEVQRLRQHGFDLEVTRAAAEYLLREGMETRLGARRLRQTIERHLQDAVVDQLFAHGACRGRVVLDADLNRLKVEPA